MSKITATLRDATCVICGTEIKTRKGQRARVYCSWGCETRDQRERRTCERRRSPSYYRAHLSTGTVGALSELTVCEDLLLRGYEVFRALSPACSCDLIAQREDRLLRIEVRTGVVNKSGVVSFPTVPMRADIFAVVTAHDPKRIFYLDKGKNPYEI